MTNCVHAKAVMSLIAGHTHYLIGIFILTELFCNIPLKQISDKILFEQIFGLESEKKLLKFRNASFEEI